MNMFKNAGGFTLVELIVVIAILAILAGVAVPAYSGYINEANDVADTTALSAVKTAATATCATMGEVTKIEVEVTTANNTSTITDIVVTYKDAAGSAKTLSVYDGDAATPTWNSDFKTYMNSTLPVLKGSYNVGATWTSTGWVAGAVSIS